MLVGIFPGSDRRRLIGQSGGLHLLKLLEETNISQIRQKVGNWVGLLQAISKECGLIEGDSRRMDSYKS